MTTRSCSPRALTYTLTLCAGLSDPDNAAGDLDGTGTDGLTIEGSPAPAVTPTISQTCEQPVISQGAGTLTLKDLAITGGNGTSFGAVSSGGTLTLDHVDQTLATVAGGSDAAAIRSAHDVVVTDSSIHDNMIMGINALGDLKLTGSSVTTNHTATGIAGGFMVSGTATLDGSDLSGNVGKEVGGGDMTNAVITGSTVNNNTGRAGGLMGTFSLTDSQLDNNYGTELSGGGIGQFAILRSSVNDNQGTRDRGRPDRRRDGHRLDDDRQLQPAGHRRGDPGADADDTLAGHLGHHREQHDHPQLRLHLRRRGRHRQLGVPPPYQRPDRAHRCRDRSVDRRGQPGHRRHDVGPTRLLRTRAELAFARWAGEPTDHGVGSLTVGSSVLGPGWGGGVDVGSLGAASVSTRRATPSRPTVRVWRGPR